MSKPETEADKKERTGAKDAPVLRIFLDPLEQQVAGQPEQISNAVQAKLARILPIRYTNIGELRVPCRLLNLLSS